MHRPAYAPRVLALALGAVLVLHAHADGGLFGHNPIPRFISGTIHLEHYDGVSDDLLTAGLGKTGLMAAAPAFADPLDPTPAELRRNAIHTNYRALVDFTAAGGFGVLYGPNIDPDGQDTLGEGKVPGTEYIAFANDEFRRENVTLMVQVPDSFDPAAPCIVTGTSSGSRGIYGAIGTSGEWGLKRGCAVAYTDKGTGNGLHDLMTDQSNLIDGRFTTASDEESTFRADLSLAEVTAFNTAYPNRVAYKHAHSQLNPEQDWGRDTLNAVRFAFYVLNAHHVPANDTQGRKRSAIRPDNTIVIASSVSNGGGAAVAAAEQDRWGLIDGVAVSEPNVQPRDTRRLTIQQGDDTVETHGLPLADYFTYANLYQPCAILSPDAGLSLNPVFWPEAFTASSEARCTELHARGLLDADTLAGQADEALARLHAYGWASEQDFLHQSHFRFATNSIVVTYANAYGRASVADNLCGYSFANTDPVTGEVVPQNPVAQEGIFATGNGIPPTTGINIVYNESVGGPRLDFLAVSPISGAADFALDGALCTRALVTGRDEATGAPLTGELGVTALRVKAGIRKVLLSARLRGKPAAIAAGRNDALLPINHTSRAYVGQNLINEPGSQIRYYEVTNAQHFDTFIAFGALLGYDTRFIPLHYYFGQTMDAMYAHLKSGSPLPPSQVVRTTPRGPGESISTANVPSIAQEPDAGDLITFSASTLLIPD